MYLTLTEFPVTRALPWDLDAVDDLVPVPCGAGTGQTLWASAACHLPRTLNITVTLAEQHQELMEYLRRTLLGCEITLSRIDRRPQGGCLGGSALLSAEAVAG
jgi:hypothetical protein